MKIAGLDIGSSGCKCTVFDEKGKYLGKAYRDYPIRRAVGSHELDVSVMMEAVYGVISEMAQQYPDIEGIGVTSFGETFAMVDEAGKPLHTAMLYTDVRGQEECRELVEKLGERRIAHITGHRPHEMYGISKMMWIRKHKPEVYAAAKRILLMEDYVVFHLTGVAQIDRSLAARTMAFDIRSLTWSQEIFDAAGIDVSLMSEVVPTGTTAGMITEKAAAKTGLSMQTKVVSISHDQVAAAVGAGAFDGSVAVDGAGTVECMIPVYDELPDLDVMYESFYSVVPYAVSGKYVTYAFLHTGGALMQWCVDNFAKKEKESAKVQGISVNELLEQQYEAEGRNDMESEQEDAVQSERGPSGLLLLPHLAGAATPYMDSGAKGAVIGLTMATTAAELYRGCMEGIVYEMYLNLQALKGSGIHFTKMHATGGGARSAVWMQMKADMLNLPITALKTADAGTVGSAMLTGVAIGLFKDLEDAAAHMVEETVTYKPRAEMHAKYKEIYERYEKVYAAVRPLV